MVSKIRFLFFSNKILDRNNKYEKSNYLLRGSGLRGVKYSNGLTPNSVKITDEYLMGFN